MTTLYKPEDINNAIKTLILKNADEDIFEFIRDIYFKLKNKYDDDDFSSETESSSEEEEDNLIIEDISVVKSEDGFYKLC